MYKLLALALLLCACSDPTECVRADRWAHAHADSLPTSLTAFRSYDKTYQQAIYAHLSLFERAGLWREHLGAFRQDYVLTAAQRRYIDSMVVELPALLTMDPEGVRYKESSARALEVMGTELAGVAFVQLGGPVMPLAESYKCNCASGHPEYYECWLGQDCDLLAPCGITWFGCGFLRLHICDGMCTSTCCS